MDNGSKIVFLVFLDMNSFKKFKASKIYVEHSLDFPWLILP